MAESLPAAQQLDKERHLRYWQRCWKTFLPTQYTSHDSTRMTIAFFIVAAFDLLSPPSASGQDQHLTAADRAKIRTWVLSLQHPLGGFCGSASHALPDELCRGISGATLEANTRNVGAANLAATFFALLLLALGADDTEDGRKSAFDGVNRQGTLRWLRRLQRPDGSFGEVLLDDGHIAGGRDMRYCHLAAMIRWCLRGNCQVGDGAWTEDIDVEALTRHIRQGQTYDGGVAESSQHEAHGMYMYASVVVEPIYLRLQQLGMHIVPSAPSPFYIDIHKIPELKTLKHRAVPYQTRRVWSSHSRSDSSHTSKRAPKTARKKMRTMPISSCPSLCKRCLCRGTCSSSVSMAVVTRSPIPATAGGLPARYQ